MELPLEIFGEICQLVDVITALRLSMCTKLLTPRFIWDHVVFIDMNQCEKRYYAHLAPLLSKLWESGIQFRSLLHLSLRIPNYCSKLSFYPNIRTMEATIKRRKPRNSLNDFWLDPQRVRNVALISRVDHGGPTFLNYISDGSHVMEGWKQQEAESLASLCNSSKPNYFVARGIAVPIYLENRPYSLNICNAESSLGWYSQQALDISDGALIIVDCVEGIWQTIDRQLALQLATRVKPVLFCNKLDRTIFELQMDAGQLYGILYDTVMRSNLLFVNGLTGEIPENGICDPQKGQVIFGSAKHGWGFSLPGIVKFLSRFFPQIAPDKILKNLWGYRYYDPEAKKIVETSVSASGKPLRQFMAQFFLTPLLSLANAAMNNDEKLPLMLQKLDIVLTEEESTKLSPVERANVVLSRWLPLSECLNDTFVNIVPSPVSINDNVPRITLPPAVWPEHARRKRPSDSWPLVTVHIHHVHGQHHPNDKEKVMCFGRVLFVRSSPQHQFQRAGDLVFFLLHRPERMKIEDLDSFDAMEDFVDNTTASALRLAKQEGDLLLLPEALDRYHPLESCRIVAYF